MTALRTITARTPDMPEDQQAELLTCYYRDLDNAVIHLQYAETKCEQLARLRYVKEAVTRLEAGIFAYGVDPA